MICLLVCENKSKSQQWKEEWKQNVRRKTHTFNLHTP
jgi:hypothetical protein